MIYKILKNIAGVCVGLAMMTGTASALPVQVEYNDIVALTNEDFESAPTGGFDFEENASFNGFDVSTPDGRLRVSVTEVFCKTSPDACLIHQSNLSGIRMLDNFVSGTNYLGLDFTKIESDDPFEIIVTGISGVSVFDSFVVSGLLGFGDEEGLVSISFRNLGREFIGFGNYAFDDVITGAGLSSVVPVPAALPLFGTGLALMGIFGWRRKRKLLQD